VEVVETLICSGSGELLYEADCPDVPGRVFLLKGVAEHGTRLGQVARLGNFDRLEIQLDGGRVIAQSRPDRLVFVAVADNQPAGQ
jgi:hypothetical protein